MESVKFLNNKRQRNEKEENIIEDIKQINTNSIINQNDKNSLKENSNIITTNKEIKSGKECPYLNTIKRYELDFDFEKQCSVSFSNMNIYACLVCGRYYQGRGIKTLAYIHSLELDHHMFINLNDEKIYCLPDGYEIKDKSLEDIQINLKPKLTEDEIKYLDLKEKTGRTLKGVLFSPGCIGLNNIKKTDYFNVIIQCLCRVSELRNYFLKYDDQLGEVVNNLYNIIYLEI